MTGVGVAASLALALLVLFSGHLYVGSALIVVSAIWLLVVFESNRPRRGLDDIPNPHSFPSWERGDR